MSIDWIARSDVVSKDDDPDARTEDVIVPCCDIKKEQGEGPLTSPDNTQLDRYSFMYCYVNYVVS